MNKNFIDSIESADTDKKPKTSAFLKLILFLTLLNTFILLYWEVWSWLERGAIQ